MTALKPSISSVIEFQSELWHWLALVAGLSVLISIVIKFRRRNSIIHKLLNRFPGPKTLPVLGNALLLYKENHEYFNLVEDLVAYHGKLLRLWLFYKPYILVSDADVVEKILASKVNLEKGDDMRVFHRWWGSGLLTAPVSKWKIQRKLINPTFSHSILLDFMDVFNNESYQLLKRLDVHSELKDEFNLVPYTTTCTLNIICETAMGKKLQTDGDLNEEYIDAVTGMYHILVARMTRPWLRSELVWKLSSFGRKESKYLKTLHGFTEKVIAEKKQIRQKMASSKSKTGSKQNDAEIIEGKKVRMAFMDYLLDLADNGSNLSDTDIRNEVDTFMAAGHDTTAYTVCWTLFLLATYPGHQELVQKEMDDIFQDDKLRSITTCDLSRMPYLGLCIKEALRIYPIVPFNIRKLTEQVECGDGKTIPAGVNVVIMPYLIHKDPKYFPEPKLFNPLRFLAENCLKRHPFAYIPFSAGPRHCIGQKFGIYESKVILTHLLRSYHWETVDERENIQLDLDLVIRPMHGLRFKIKKR